MADPVPAVVKVVVFVAVLSTSLLLKITIPVELVEKDKFAARLFIFTWPAEFVEAVVEAPVLVNKELSNCITPVEDMVYNEMPVVPIFPVQLNILTFEEEEDELNVIPVLFVQLR